MKSNLLSRLLPPTGSSSVYETIRQHDADSETSDLEERAGMAPGENQNRGYSDQELEEAMAEGRISGSASPGVEFLTPEQPPMPPAESPDTAHPRRRQSRRPRWMRRSPSNLGADEGDEGDDDVPASLLVEGRQDDEDPKTHRTPLTQHRVGSDTPVPGPSSAENLARWETARTQQPLHQSFQRHNPLKRWSVGQHPSLASVDPKQKAMWRWANVENLDNFVRDVYTYFLGNGIWSILLTRALNLLCVNIHCCLNFVHY